MLVDSLLNAREEQHGEFSSNSDVSQRLKEEMHVSLNWDRLSTDKRESLEMIQHKIARILNGDPEHRDHWDDIAGYAKLASYRVKRKTGDT